MWTDGSRPCYDKFRSSVLDRQCRRFVFNESPPPQVICIFFLPCWVTRYWACCGFVLGVLLRTLGGEPLIGLPDVLPLPWDNIQEDGHQYHLFSFRTAIMLINTGTILLISQLTEWLYEKSFLKTNPHTDYNIHYTAPVLVSQCLTDPLKSTKERENCCDAIFMAGNKHKWKTGP